MSKQDRQGVRTPAGLEQKYDLGKSLSNLEAKAKANAEQISKQGQRIDSISENQDERFSALEKGISIAEKNIDTLKENVNSLQIRMTNSEEHSLELENEVWSLARRITATEKVVEQLKQAQAVMVDINSLYRRFTPRNLLDNSDFTNPVNQRGATTGTAWQYCIDRFISRDSNLILSFANDGMTLSNSDAKENYIYQKVANYERLLGKKVTLAAKANGDVLIATANIPTTLPSSWTTYITVVKNDALITIFSSSNNNVCCSVGFNAGKTAKVEWIALYEGEYTEDTLPEYQPTGYGAELAECRRYYRVFDAKENDSLGIAMARNTTTLALFFDLGAMRVAPAITFTGKVKALGSTTMTGLTMTTDSYANGIKRVNVVGSGFTIGYSYIVAGDTSGAKLEFNADL